MSGSLTKRTNCRSRTLTSRTARNMSSPAVRTAATGTAKMTAVMMSSRISPAKAADAEKPEKRIKLRRMTD